MQSKPAAARRPGAPAKIDHTRLLDAAIRLVDEEGIDALTARSLALRVGVAAPTLYAHVRGMDDLLDAVVEHLMERSLRGFRVPRRAGPAVQAMGRKLRAILLEHPAFLEAIQRGPITSASALRVTDAVLGSLLRSGLDAEGAVQAYSALYAYVVGFAALEHGRANQGGTAGNRVRQLGGRAEAHGLPHLVACAGELPDLLSTATFERGLELLSAAIAPGGDAPGQDRDREQSGGRRPRATPVRSASG